MDLFNKSYITPGVNTLNFKPYELPLPIPVNKFIDIKPFVPKPLPINNSIHGFGINDKYLRPSDTFKLDRVKAWVKVNNPVTATCRNCNHTGLVDNSCIGLY
jgi:hypothetical protein